MPTERLPPQGAATATNTAQEVVETHQPRAHNLSLKITRTLCMQPTVNSQHMHTCIMHTNGKPPPPPSKHRRHNQLRRANGWLLAELCCIETLIVSNLVTYCHVLGMSVCVYVHICIWVGVVVGVGVGVGEPDLKESVLEKITASCTRSVKQSRQG